MDFEPLPAISIRHRVAMLSSSVPEDLQTLLSIRRRVLIWLLSQAFLPHYFKEGTGAGGNQFNLSSISNQAHPATFLVRSLIEVDSPCDINLLMTMWRKPLVLPERFHDLLKTLVQEIKGIKGMKGSEVEELRGSEKDSQLLQRVWVSDNVYNTRKVKRDLFKMSRSKFGQPSPAVHPSFHRLSPSLVRLLLASLPRGQLDCDAVNTRWSIRKSKSAPFCPPPSHIAADILQEPHAQYIEEAYRVLLSEIQTPGRSGGSSWSNQSTFSYLSNISYRYIPSSSSPSSTTTSTNTTVVAKSLEAEKQVAEIRKRSSNKRTQRKKNAKARSKLAEKTSLNEMIAQASKPGEADRDQASEPGEVDYEGEEADQASHPGEADREGEEADQASEPGEVDRKEGSQHGEMNWEEETDQASQHEEAYWEGEEPDQANEPEDIRGEARRDRIDAGLAWFYESEEE